MITTEYNILFSFLSSLIITYISIPKIIFFAEEFRLADVPGKRASHKLSMPIFGGMAIFLGIIFSLLFWSEFANIQFIIVSLIIIFFIGIVDDLLGLSPFKKLVGQCIAILIIIYLGEMQIDNMHNVLGVQELSDFAATLFTIFVVIVITNGFNLIDGVDGLAAGIAVISSSFFGTIAFFMNQFEMSLIAFSLMGALLAFLKYNFHPARIFMGDTGSLLVGMILSILAINLIKNGVVIEAFHFPNKGPLFAILFLAIPLFDSLRVFVVRIYKGVGPLSPARDHIHHALLDLDLGHKKTTVILYILSFSLILCSYFFIELNINLGIIILTSISYIILFIPFYILGKRS